MKRVRNAEVMNLLLELSRAEDAPTLSSVKPPVVAVADYDDMAVAARVALLGVGNAPIETLGSWNARTVEHPPACLSTSVLLQ
jgi:hypothetical protein